MEILHLTLKKKWFDMIASGEKTEEYREVKPYWVNRLTWHEFHGMNLEQLKRQGGIPFKTIYQYVKFTNGYGKNAPTITLSLLSISIGNAKPEWSDNWEGDVFILELGAIL